LNRILPLRKNDKLILLGDYIDRGPSSKDVLEKLIFLKSKYPSQTVFLMGNHEWLLLSSLGYIDNANDIVEHPTPMWLQNGGITTLQSYVPDSKFTIYDMFSFTKERLIPLIKSEHIDFLKNLPYYYAIDDYIFVHAGCDPTVDLKMQDKETFIWDRSLFEFASMMITAKKTLQWNKCIITGHNYKGPIINNKYIMIDCSGSNKILCYELNSRTGFFAEVGNKRLVKLESN
jgi:serine/threonine protein phosphatase 1